VIGENGMRGAGSVRYLVQDRKTQQNASAAPCPAFVDAALRAQQRSAAASA